MADAPVVAPVSAPAAPEAPATISPTKAAATAGDFSAFDRADRAARAGKPLADVPVPVSPPNPKLPRRATAPAPAAVIETPEEEPVEAAPPENRQTRAQKEQARINQSIRDGVNARLAELGLTGARPTPPVTPPPASAVPPAESTPEWKQLVAQIKADPQAPKLSDYESVEEHTAAMAAYVAFTTQAARDAASAQAAARSAAATAAQQEVDTFLSRLQEAKAADPDFPTKVSAEVQALKPFGALAPGETGGPANVVASEVMKSPEVARLLVHLSQPGELAKLLTVPPAIAGMPPGPAQIRAHIAHLQTEIHRLEGRLAFTASSTAAPAPPEASPSPISRAPAPPATITRARSTADPKAAAIARNDFAAFDQLEQAAELERRKVRAGVAV